MKLILGVVVMTLAACSAGAPTVRTETITVMTPVPSPVVQVTVRTPPSCRSAIDAADRAFRAFARSMAYAIDGNYGSAYYYGDIAARAKQMYQRAATTCYRS